MGRLLYFAYGSNMLSKRLRARVPSAVRRGIGYICGHRLTFDKRSTDGSGKCDAEGTLVPEGRVYGVVYEIDSDQKAQLDRAEGLGHGYAQKNVEVISGEATLRAVTYYATCKDSSLQPYHWYKEYVLAGARENSLPAAHIKLIESIESVDDSDAPRAARAQAVLHSN
jgi:gamma-glutamylcyclotransferase